MALPVLAVRVPESRRGPAGAPAPRRTGASLQRLEGLRVLFSTRTLEGSVDFNNMFNANTVWSVRTLSGTINLRQDGNPTGRLNTVPQFLSPAQVYPPRNIRFNVAYRF